uniref:Uncharacterized protein n=1 Tax=Ciona intestinalis TaxID=7719 RepID=H2XZ53_CIOIN
QYRNITKSIIYELLLNFEHEKCNTQHKPELFKTLPFFSYSMGMAKVKYTVALFMYKS